MGSVPVQVPLVVLRTWPTRAVPVIAGSLAFLGATAGAADESAAQAAKSPPRAATAAATPTIAMYVRWRCVVRLLMWSLPSGCLRRGGYPGAPEPKDGSRSPYRVLTGPSRRVSRPIGAGNHDFDSDGGEHTMETWEWIVLTAAVVAALLLAVAFVRIRTRRSHLKERFGMEYQRAVADQGVGP